MITRLAYSLDWRAALMHLLRLPDATSALRTWVLTTQVDETPIKQLELADGFFVRLGACTSRDEAERLLHQDLGPKYLPTPQPVNVFGVLHQPPPIPVDTIFASLRTAAMEACNTLSTRYLPTFVGTHACFRLLEERTAANATNAASLLWDPHAKYNARVRGWLQEVASLGLGLSAMFTISDVTYDESQPLVFVNAALCTAVGAQPRQLLGRHLCDVLAGPKSDENAHQTLRQAMRHGKDCLVGIVSYRRGGGAEFSSLLATRNFSTAGGTVKRGCRFCVSLQVEIDAGRPVRQLVQKLAKLMTLMPFSTVPP